MENPVDIEHGFIESDFLFRRLRTSDTKALENLCDQDKRWDRYFPKHRAWLDRAIKELNRPGRTAIGAFAPTRNAAGALENRLEAGLFLKVSDYENSAELKNISLSSHPKTQTLHRALVRSLVLKAFRYCEVREISRLEIELPQAEHQLIAIFLDLQFKVAAVRDRYNPGQNICVLEKVIGETYRGDPFDLVRLGKWLMRALVPCKFIESFLCQMQGVDGAACLVFETFPLHPAFSPQEKSKTGYERRLRIGIALLDEPWSDDENIRTLLNHQMFLGLPLKYALVQDLSMDAATLLGSRGVNVMHWDEVKEISGNTDSSLSIPFEQDSLGGVLTVLELELIDQYLQYENGFAYYLLSGLGAALYPFRVGEEPDGEIPLLLAIYCPLWRDGRRGIVGVAEIISIEKPPLKTAHTSFAGVQRPISRDDLDSYRTRSDVDDVLPVLLCKRLTIFDRVLTLDSPEWAGHAEMRDYLERELMSPMNSVYLDTGSASMLRNFAKRHEQPHVETNEQSPRHHEHGNASKPSGSPQSAQAGTQKEPDHSVMSLLTEAMSLAASCWPELSRFSPEEYHNFRDLDCFLDGDQFVIQLNRRDWLRIDKREIRLSQSSFTHLRDLVSAATKRWEIYNKDKVTIVTLSSDERNRVGHRMMDDLEQLYQSIEEILGVIETAIARHIRSMLRDQGSEA